MLLSVFLLIVCTWAANGSDLLNFLDKDKPHHKVPTSDLCGEPADGSTFRVDYQFYPRADGWLKLHRFPVPWKEALLTCYFEGAYLASPITEGLSEVMTYIAQNERLKPVHTGIHFLATPTDYSSLEGIPLKNIHHLKWAEGEPNNDGYELKKQNVLIMSREGEMSDANKTDVRPFFCYKRKEGHTTMNKCGYHDKLYQMDQNSGRCYKYHASAKSWLRALQVCAGEGGSLAVINSHAEAQFIDLLVAPHGHKDWVHVGFLALNYEDLKTPVVWWTLDGKPLKESGYDRWLKGEPNNSGGEYCGSFRRGTGNELLLLNDINCSQAWPFVCEIPPIETYLFRIPN